MKINDLSDTDFADDADLNQKGKPRYPRHPRLKNIIMTVDSYFDTPSFFIRYLRLRQPHRFLFQTNLLLELASSEQVNEATRLVLVFFLIREVPEHAVYLSL